MDSLSFSAFLSICSLKKRRLWELSADSFLSAGEATVAMLNVEKVLKDLNLSLARFGDSDVVTTRPLLSVQFDGSEVHRLHREIAARLRFKIE